MRCLSTPSQSKINTILDDFSRFTKKNDFTYIPNSKTAKIASFVSEWITTLEFNQNDLWQKKHHQSE